MARTLFTYVLNDQVSDDLRKIAAENEHLEAKFKELGIATGKFEGDLDGASRAAKQLKKEASRFGKESKEFRSMSRAADDLKQSLGPGGAVRSVNQLSGEINQLTKDINESVDASRRLELIAKRAALIEQRSAAQGRGRMPGPAARGPAGGGGGMLGGLGGGGGIGVGQLARFAGPAAIAAGAIKVGSVVVEGIQEVGELRNQMRLLSNERGDALNKITGEVRATAKVFGVEQNEIAQTAKALQSAFPELKNFSDANNALNQGFLAGANVRGDFLNQVKEYGTQFRDAGFSVDEFTAFLAQSEKAGVFSDKAADSVKEFGLRIREQTTATQDALRAAFGSGFTDQLLAGVRSGEVSTKEALQAVTAQMASFKGDAAQLQTVVADVFGGPGEDVGMEFLKNLGSMKFATNELIDATDPMVKHQQEMIKLQQELATTQADAAEKLLPLELGWEKFKVQALTALTSVIGGLSDFGEAVGDHFDEFGTFLGDILRANGILEDNVKINLGGSVAQSSKKLIEDAKKLAQNAPKPAARSARATAVIGRAGRSGGLGIAGGAAGTGSSAQSLGTVTTGGTQTRNVSVRIEKLVENVNIQGGLGDGVTRAEVPALVAEVLTGAVRESEIALN